MYARLTNCMSDIVLELKHLLLNVDSKAVLRHVEKQ